jgi:uncharacterized protein YggU (UPF0235/DUF167 family)
VPCDFLRAESETHCETLFETPSKANTYGIAVTVTTPPQPTAPPEKGRANDAVVEMLAERLGLFADAVSVVSGQSSAYKVVAINGMDEESLKKALG